MNYDVIIDGYTDEPSGLGVPPFLSVHSRYIVGALSQQKRKYYYLTIDDLYTLSEQEVIDKIKDEKIKKEIKNIQ